MPVGWLSLDPDDNDPARFWRYVVAALGRVVGGLGEHTAPLLGPVSVTSSQGVVPALLNQLQTQPDELVLVPAPKPHRRPAAGSCCAGLRCGDRAPAPGRPGVLAGESADRRERPRRNRAGRAPDRELEVRRLLAAGWRNRDLARELVVTVETVKKHISHILDKLGGQPHRGRRPGRRLGLIT